MGPIDEDRRRRFERHRLDGGTEPVEAFLPPDDDPALPGTLEELVMIDLEFRFRARSGGAPPPSADDYDHPLLADPEVRRRVDAECELLARRFSAERLEAGTRLGACVLSSVAGRGAFAEVWRAFDERLRRDVAIKVPRADLAGDRTVFERVLREARSAARLRHPRIVAVHEVGTHEGRPYIVSGLVSGPTLTEELRHRTLSPDEAARLVADVAETVHYAHECGVVHRDLKPGNILIDADGRPVLTDFGLATLPAAGRKLTRHGELLGTPAYMSPEQARGDTSAVGPPSDVYSLGAILYELLAGRLPFDEASIASTLYAVVHRDPPAPRAVRPGVPADLETVCLKAMAKEPGRRYGSAADLAADLRRFLARQPVRARRRGPWGRLLLWGRRNPALAATLVASVLVVAAVAAVGFANVVTERNRFREQRDRARENLYRSLVREAEALLVAREADWYPKTLERIGEAARLEARDVRALRDLVLRCESVKEPSFSKVAEWAPSAGKPRAVVFSPDGRRLADATHDDVVRVRDVATGEEVWRRDLPGWRLAWHPAGRELAVSGDDGRVWFLDPSTGETRAAAEEETGDPVYALAYSPSGNVLVAGRRSGAIQLVPRSGSTARTLPGHAGGTYAVAFSPDGGLLASGGEDGRVLVRDLATGREVATTRFANPIRHVDFTRDGKEVVYVAWETFSFALLSVPGGEVRETVQTIHEASVRAVFPRRDGRIVTASEDGSLRMWTTTFQPVTVARAGHGPIRMAARHGDERFAASHADGTVTVWSLDRPAASRYFHTVHQAAFVPGTSRLVTSHAALDAASGSVDALDLSPVRAVATDPAAGRLYAAAADGTLLVWKRGADDPRRIDTGLDPVALTVADDGRLAVGTASGEVLLGTAGALRPVLSGQGSVRELLFDGEGLLVLSEEGLSRWPEAGGSKTLDGIRHRVGAIAGVVAVALAPGRIAWADENRRVRIRRVDDDAPPPVVHEYRCDVDWIAFDPAGELLAVGGRQGEGEVLDAATGRLLAVLTGAGTTCGVFDPARDSLVTGNVVGGVWRWNRGRLRGAAARLIHDRTLLPGGPGHQIWGVTADPKGRWFATADQAGIVKLYDARTLRILRALTGPGHPAWTCTFSPDGEAIAAGVGRDVLLLDPAGDGAPRRLTAHRELVKALAFHPTEPLLASTDGRRSIRLTDPRTGDARGELDAGAVGVLSLAFRPDGARLAAATSDGSVVVWSEIRDGAEPERVLPGHDSPAWAVAWGGGLLASGAAEGDVLLRDGASLEPVARLRGEVRLVRSLSFDSGGRFLAAGCYLRDSILWDLDALRARLRTVDLDW